MRRQPIRSANIMLRGSLLIFVLALPVVTGWAEAPALSPQSAAPAQAALRDVESLPPGTMLPPGTIGVPARTVPAQGAPMQSVPAAAPVVPGAGYWIVSSRQCKDKSPPGNLGCMQFYFRSSDRDLRNLGRDAFVSSLNPDQPVCFVVHGSYNWWRDVLTESKRIHRWIHSAATESPVQVVFFTWPSDGNMPYVFPIDIARLGRKASLHSVYLANLVAQLPPEQPVCLLGHSHGARSAVAAMHLLGGGSVEDGQSLPPGYATPTHLRAVLIAAAIDHNWMNPGQRYDKALLPAEHVLLLRNSRDATLAIYPLRKGYSERAIGKDGLGRDDRFAIDEMGKKVVELDAAAFAGSNHSFADYHEHPELASAMKPYVYFSDDRAETMPTAPYEPAPTMPSTTRPEPASSATVATPSSAPVDASPAVSGPSLGGPAPASSSDGPSPGPSKFAPTTLSPIVDEEAPPLSDDPQAGDDRGRVVKIMPRARPATHTIAPIAAESSRTPIPSEDSASDGERVMKIMPRARPATGTPSPTTVESDRSPPSSDDASSGGERIMKIMPRARPAARPESQAQPAKPVEHKPPAPKKKRSPFLID